jgi:hypothetical protein
MNPLVRIFGWPHELLHVLALLLIGRRPKALTQTHVDIPDDLSTGQYVFVAGLPALVFWPIAVLCIQGVFNAQGIVALVVWVFLSVIATLAAIGTLGDLYLIVMRLMEE